MSVNFFPLAGRGSDAIVAVLSDTVNGFNPFMVAAASHYDCDPYSLDFTVPQSDNFVLGQLNLADFYSDDNLALPAMGISVMSDMEDGTIESARYSGSVTYQIELLLGMSGFNSPTDLYPSVCASHDAVINALNARENWAYWDTYKVNPLRRTQCIIEKPRVLGTDSSVVIQKLTFITGYFIGVV